MKTLELWEGKGERPILHTKKTSTLSDGREVGYLLPEYDWALAIGEDDFLLGKDGMFGRERDKLLELYRAIPRKDDRLKIRNAAVKLKRHYKREVLDAKGN